MGYAFMGRTASSSSRSASASAPTRAVSSVKKYHKTDQARKPGRLDVRLEAIKEAKAMLQDEPDEEVRSQFINSHTAEMLDEFDKKSKQLSHELALQASDDISEMGDVSFGSFGSD
jgi:hypothetical protein